MSSIKKIRIRDHPEYEFVENENDVLNLVNTYLGEDARIYLEYLINDLKDRINELENTPENMRETYYDSSDVDEIAEERVDNAITDFKNDLIKFIKDY